MPTPSINTLSLRIDAERVRLENLAVESVARVGEVARRHAIAAARIGADPVAAARDVLWGNAAIGQGGLEELVTRCLVSSYLLGMRRTGLNAREYFGRELIVLSRAGDEIRGWLGRLVDKAALAETEVAGLFQRARAAAGRIVRRMTAPLMRRLSGATADPDAPRTLLREVTTQFERAGFLPDAEHGIGSELSTAMVGAYEQGRGRGWRTPEVRESLWGFRYSAIRDGRTSKLCRGLDGTVLPAADPFWAQWTPPNHFNCRSCVVEVWEGPRLREPPAETRGYQQFGAEFFIG